MKGFAALVISAVVVLLLPVAAHAALTVEPITWNIVGLDSNDVLTGPNTFPVGVRVCSNVATTNVSVSFLWDSANTNINLRAGSLSTIILPSIGAGGCADAYFEAEVTRTAAAFDTTRRYHIEATDVSGTFSSPTPRELYVEHLISQARNSVTNLQYGPNIPGLVSVPAGGSLNLVVGETYVIRLFGGTATQGYNQFEKFINFSNTVFQILSVDTTYSADNSPFVDNPSDKLYADACGWENDPNSPNYLSCVGGDFKAGGSNVVTTYTIRIVSGGGTSQTLGSLLYDFSGSSFHYNADYSTGARVANIIDPASATISKSFSPNPAPLNGVSALTFTLTNPNAGTLGGYNFVDNLPANLIVATPPATTTSGCGTPTLTAVAGSSTISFSNGTLAANSNCVIKVNVTPTATGALTNTTNNLFVGTVDTGDNASAILTVNTEPPPGTGICGLPLATWAFPTGFNVTAPAPSTSTVGTASAIGIGLNAQQTTESTISGTAGSSSWGTNGGVATGPTLTTTNDDYFELAVNTTGITSVALSFQARRTNNGAQGLAVFVGTTNTRPETGTSVFSNSAALGPVVGTAWTPFGPITVNSGLNPSGLTYFRIYGFNATNSNPGSDLSIDNVSLTACGTAVKPTITKSFTPDPIAVNGVSTLTFTLTNTNSAQLTGATFTDPLPAGLQVAAIPAASTTCTGAPTWAPGAGSTTLTFGTPTGANIPASGSCTVSVNVTATTPGAHANVSGFLSTTESGTTTTSVATDTLTAVLPPMISKQFAPTPILAGGVSKLTFLITNPNQDNAIGGVAFGDTFPVAPGAMTVAATPNATTSGCGSPTFAPAPGAGSISFSGGTIAGGATCTVTVDVTAPVTGTYNNTSGAVSHIINAQTVNGNTASDSLDVVPPNPSIALLKQVGLSATGPWTSFQAVNSGPVFYRFTIENTGDVPLNPISLTDDTLDVSACNAVLAATTLPVAVAANDNHIVQCVVGPIATSSGLHTNTAFSTGTFGGTPYNSEESEAVYATTGLTLDKTSVQSTYTLVGDTINYNYLVTNSGFAPLEGPVTITDDKTTATCPAVSTVGDLDNFLDPGESVTCTASYTIVLADITNAFVTNTATASADGVTSPSDSATVFLSTAADVSIVKTLTTAGPYTNGQSITYSLFVANAGPSTATNVQVTDTPSNLTITMVSGGGCVALPCTIPTLASGANTTITVTATINSSGAFDNSATVDATEPDPDLTDNTDNTGNGGSADASADVSIAKTLLTAGPYVVGQTISYSLFVENAGASTATNIQVTDTPSNLSITGVSGACATLPCTIASLAMGANATITVTATITATGAFDNVATANAVEPDPDTSNNTDNTGNGGTADPSADVSVVKTLATAGPYVVGQTISYSLFVANAGPSTATNVQVTDTPTNLTITGVSGGGCVALPCTIASLAMGANASITVTATIDAAGAFDNSATVDATESDPNLGNNTDNTSNGGTAALSADVSIVKTLNTAGPFVPGQTISYTLFVANAGPNTATNVQVTDTPTNLSITGVSGGGCAALPCTIASLASGANASINVTATIDEPGAFDNSASANADEPDPDSTDNTDDTDNGGEAESSADVSIAKTLDTAGPFSVGQTITYTLFVANAGPNTATNVQVTDTPSNLTITGVSGSGCTALPCAIDFLVSGDSATITVTATIDAAGAFDNSASANADEPDPDSSNNTDNSGNGGQTGPSADVSIAKTLDTAGPFFPGQTISYTLLVENAGPSTATNVQVTDTPSNLTITGVSGGGCAALPCTIASLAMGASASITVTATIDAAGAFDNSASANADEPDPDSSNNTDNSGNGGTATPSADVSITKTLDTAGPFTAGQSITYTLVVANAGPNTATNVQVTDTPTNLTITGVSGGGCAALPCTIASLASGANATITVTATIDAAGGFDNVASANADEPDPDSSNNTDNTGNDGQTGPSADVSIVKTLDTAGPFSAGQSITYTLLVANAGPSTATNVQVTDTPSNLTITGVSGACAALPCTIASLASGANASITVTATIDAAGAFDNVASANADQPDPDSSNNTDNSGNGGQTGPSADVSIVKTLDTAGPFVPGQSVTYTLLVANAGPSTATNVQVTDTPSNLTITNVSGSGCAALPCTIASLASGANTSITVTATIDAVGSFNNIASANADEPDPDSSNNTDNTGNGGEAEPSADVSMVKTLTTAGPFTVGQTISYSLLVANAGPSTATNIQVTDTPTNLTITGVSGACAALPCTIAAIASGANASITVTATIDAEGAFDNEATALAKEPDPDTDDNTDDSGNGGNTGPSADVSVVKTLDTAGPYTIGQAITYSLLVANAGPSTATNVQITDTPSNLTITSVSGGGCAALPCTIASLASGANATITVNATVDDAGAFNNTATVDADEPDPDTDDNTDDTGNGGNAAASANVSIVKTLDTAGPFTAGQSISYSLLVSNAGPSTATNVQVTDTPSNLSITSVSGGGCAALPCTIASLASGANATITVTATITTDGAFDNVATATATEPDPDTDDNTDDTGNGGNTDPSADVSIVKMLDTAGPFVVGQSITYTLVVANAGPSTATNVQVTDTPTNLTITSVSGGGCAALPCTIASIASGANATITVTATIDADGTFDNVATATGTEPDPDTDDNTDDTGNDGGTTPTADMSLIKTLVTAGPFTVGQTITYTLDVTNAGPSIATAVEVTDTPENLTITSVSGGGCAALPCTIASMASGASVTITVTATIDADGAFDNSATVSATETETNFTDNTDNTGNGGSTGPMADMSLVKTLTTAGPFVPGQSINYTLDVANAGPSIATDIEVTDTPTNLTITSVSGGGCAALPCTILSMAAGASVTINVTATIDAAGAFDNSATVSATETETDFSNNTDNTGNGGTAPAPEADLEITKTASAAMATVGQTLTFTLEVENHGPSIATGVVVTDPLPSNFTLISATPTQGTCSGTTTVTCNLGTLAVNATATITISGTVTTMSGLTNTATVDATEPDPNSANNTDSASVGPQEDIPTVSEIGLMLLAMMLGVAAVLRMRGV